MTSKPALSSPADRAAGSPWLRLTLPQLVDQRAREEPDSVYGSWPVDPNSYSAGVRNVTYAQLASIVNALAGWLDKELGPGKQDEAVAYVGPNDVRFTALGYAGMKTGHRVSWNTYDEEKMRVNELKVSRYFSLLRAIVRLRIKSFSVRLIARRLSRQIQHFHTQSQSWKLLRDVAL